MATDEGTAAMNWLGFGASVFGSLAWPITILFLALVFRAEIRLLLRRLKSLSPSGQAEFYRDVEEAEQIVKEKPLPRPSDDRPKANISADWGGGTGSDWGFSPEAAIAADWARFERTLQRLAVELGREDYRDRPALSLVPLLVENQLIDDDTKKLIELLRSARNNIAHSRWDLTNADAQRFRDLVRAALRRISIPDAPPPTSPRPDDR